MAGSIDAPRGREAAREASRPGWAHPEYDWDEPSFIDPDRRPDDGEELPFCADNIATKRLRWPLGEGAWAGTYS